MNAIRYKLVSVRGEPWELNDLIHDPVEVNNLASAQSARVVDMSAEWYPLAEEFDAVPLKDRLPRAARSAPWGYNAHDKPNGKKACPEKESSHRLGMAENPRYHCW